MHTGSESRTTSESHSTANIRAYPDQALFLTQLSQLSFFEGVCCVSIFLILLFCTNPGDVERWSEDTHLQELHVPQQARLQGQNSVGRWKWDRHLIHVRGQGRGEARVRGKTKRYDAAPPGSIHCGAHTARKTGTYIHFFNILAKLPIIL